MILDQFKLHGKVAIVTGARKGIGQSIAIALAEAGADIVGVGRNEMPETQKSIAELGRRFLFVKADLLTTEPLERILHEATGEYGKADILVNNSGIVRRADALSYTEADWDAVLNINLKSTFFLSQTFAKQIVRQESGGRIINIASLLSYRASPRGISYGASKHGVLGVTKTMAVSFARYGITCNAIVPGYIETDQTLLLRNDAELYEKMRSEIPLGRWGQPNDLQGAVVFLASAASAYMTGATVCVDGGWLAK